MERPPLLSVCVKELLRSNFCCAAASPPRREEGRREDRRDERWQAGSAADDATPAAEVAYMAFAKKIGEGS